MKKKLSLSGVHVIVVVIFYKRKCDVRFDLLKWGMYEKYTSWEFHGELYDDSSDEENDNGNVFGNHDSGFAMLQDACGVAAMNVGLDEDTSNENNLMPEEPNADAQKFYRLLKEYQQPLTVDGTTMPKLSYIVKLLHLKVLNKWSGSSFDSLLKLQRQAYGSTIPDSYYEAKKLIKDLGLDYIKIDACQNYCTLYWKEKENLTKCPTCGLLRWKSDEKGSSKSITKVPHKVLRYFPLKPRLQRLYMFRKTAEDMRWHSEDKFNDDIMRHPRDSIAWKSFDMEFSAFGKESRNVRLGLACDGFQPFNNSQHSTWPVVLIPYNLPPWICMKAHSFMLTLLIPGPTSPGRNIDVYLQPLIDELKELWNIGIETYDAFSKENFQMHAAVLWTIKDFLAYGDLSGWTTKGHFACPCCHKETKRTSLLSKGGYLDHRRWLPLDHIWRQDVASFNNKKEKRRSPLPLSGEEVLQHLSRFTPEKFGKNSNKRKRDASNSLYGWHKRSIFF
ncbi:uncharacterized protein LOC110688702 isoform X1 [Chenopodium quinoa]|uniref:uncharacterized protein LOC110688702 isoform X1 n=1 Tax=Chenopodium quinoa TaxID=63459 RepID=UPI000B770669|nr:uncharacterized protein LOC110688702 isoform X1 [Chenopodium quinoa]XP_021721141.1 uncharacterized protein LOC110688702 isoform X1 [Chenopodium quinoa]XP_021721142.1 uncharacterized protein LOC110688702 isoform X1 [Chenopodium quinoa]